MTSRATSTVLGFVLGARPGPRRMTVQWQGLRTFDLDGVEELFPMAADIESTKLHVGSSIFKIYYDKERHMQNAEECVYVSALGWTKGHIAHERCTWWRIEAEE